MGYRSHRSFGKRVFISLAIALTAIAASCGLGGGGGSGGGGNDNPPPFDLTEAREFRAIVGVSMGGYGALNLGTKHTDLFGTIGSLGGPVDMTQLLADIIDDNIEVKPQTEIPRAVGSDFTFDHLAPYPDRDSRASMVQDLVIALGNPYLHNPDPDHLYLASDSEPAHIMQDDQFGAFTTLADPRGFLNGGDTNQDGLRQVDEAPTTPVDVLLMAGGTLERIAGVHGTLVGGRETVDLNGDGVYDVGDGIVVNLSEPFTDGNGNHVFEPSLGETFTDAGLDGVPGTGDFGEGNGQFDYDPDRATFIAQDPLTRLNGRSAADISTQRIYMDVGERDEFGFSKHYDHVVAALRAKGLTVTVQDGFSSNCLAVEHPDEQFLLVRYPGGHIGIEKVDNDDLFNGDFCGPILVWQRILTLLGYLDGSFPDGVRGPGNVDSGSFDPPGFDPPDFKPPSVDLPGIRLSGEMVSATIDSPALGAGAKSRDVLVYRPPAFFNNKGDSFPVVYYLVGYGQTPDDYARMKDLLDVLIVTGQIQNMSVAFLPGAGGREGSFYVNHVVPETQVPEIPEITSGRYEDSVIQDLIPAIERNILNNRVKH